MTTIDDCSCFVLPVLVVITVLLQRVQDVWLQGPGFMERIAWRVTTNLHVQAPGSDTSVLKNALRRIMLQLCCGQN